MFLLLMPDATVLTAPSLKTVKDYFGDTEVTVMTFNPVDRRWEDVSEIIRPWEPDPLADWEKVLLCGVGHNSAGSLSDGVLTCAGCGVKTSRT